jgi:hypothetical protein
VLQEHSERLRGVRLADLDPKALRVVEDLIIGDGFASPPIAVCA